MQYGMHFYIRMLLNPLDAGIVRTLTFLDLILTAGDKMVSNLEYGAAIGLSNHVVLSYNINGKSTNTSLAETYWVATRT